MRKRILEFDNTNYKINRHFGTKSVEDLITESVVNICNSSMVLTTTDHSTYNILGSVGEVTK